MSDPFFRRHLSRTPVILLALLILLAFPGMSVQAAGFSDSWPYKAEQMEARQVVVVEAAERSSQSGVLSLREKRGGQWVALLSGIPVSLGKGGLGKTKEGDGRTPSGVFRLGHAFGFAAQPAGLRLPYTRTSPTDFWVDDPASPDYNTWISYSGNPQQRWSSYEALQHPLYKYAVTVSYNTNPVIPGKGSAIFLHLWRGPGQPTAGCIAMSEPDLLRLMQALDPGLSPAIAIGIAD
ncbi:L,D-transpeptidase family protein [Paenibacillus tepidiphilus]|uniref:L,D-transpeptidase family protein n=1 Tax=Paenibacillus tepidiphilus TaxID=2608683 RepID=UPI001EF12052|nr:L,D-transpeptidase family protein [Paenibacillus tepidiphilus]